MKNLLMLAAGNSKVIVGFLIAKGIFSVLVSIAVLAFIFNNFGNPIDMFSENSQIIGAEAAEMDAIENYLETGELTDEVPQNVIDVVEQRKAIEAQMEAQMEVFNAQRQIVMDTINSDTTNESFMEAFKQQQQKIAEIEQSIQSSYTAPETSPQISTESEPEVSITPEDITIVDPKPLESITSSTFTAIQ